MPTAWCSLPLPRCLHSDRAEKLRDDFRAYMPDLLPKLVALFTDAERTGDFTMVRRAALRCVLSW